jgi:hypothetical protein
MIHSPARHEKGSRRTIHSIRGHEEEATETAVPPWLVSHRTGRDDDGDYGGGGGGARDRMTMVNTMEISKMSRGCVHKYDLSTSRNSQMAAFVLAACVTYRTYYTIYMKWRAGRPCVGPNFDPISQLPYAGTVSRYSHTTGSGGICVP